MNIEKNYAKIFEELVRGTQDYIVGNGLRAMVLGISGGIDSTVVAAICHEVSKRTNIPLIGRSLPTHFNKKEEVSSADLVGNAFCNDYLEVPITNLFTSCVLWLNCKEKVEQTPLADGNIQARIRMMYLYNIAGLYNGLVMDTDNLTENNLGYFTIHGDVGDFNPIGGLWKTEVFELAKWIHNDYYNKARCLEEGHFYQQADEIALKLEAIKESLKLKPTAGLGITNNDLEELGAESYDQVDTILKDVLSWKCRESMFAWKEREHPLEDYLKEHRIKDIPYEIIERVATRHFKSEFKRKQLPIKI